MESSKLLKKLIKLYEKLKEHYSDKVSILNELFELLFLLKNKYKISFDLESFTKYSLKDRDNYNFENESKDDLENSIKIKKVTKKLFNLSLLHLFQLLQDEKYFDFGLDKLVELLEFEFEIVMDVKGVKNVELFELFLNTLFYGNFYHKGLVQHFLLNSRYTVHIPFTLNNIIKNMEKNKKINEYLNNDDLIDYNTFYERFLIFVSKLNTPDKYTSYESNQSNQNKILKIPKKELALKNPIKYLQNNNYNENGDNLGYPYEDGDQDEYSSSDDSTVDEENEDQGSDDYDYGINGDGRDDKYKGELFYGNNYIKLWENILSEVLYSVDERNLTIILESIPLLAFPYINNPLRIANYLYNSLKSKNENVVVNSLNCLFELILYHNLTDQIDLVSIKVNYNHSTTTSNTDSNNNTNNTSLNEHKDNTNKDNENNNNEFDWFYQKLYDLIDFRYLSSNSNIVLVLLIEKALNSSMLPNNLVSSFIKKLLTVSTLLETNMCNCLLIISLNLLQNHYHHLLFLIHSPLDTNISPRMNTNNITSNTTNGNTTNNDNGISNSSSTNKTSTTSNNTRTEVEVMFDQEDQDVDNEGRSCDLGEVREVEVRLENEIENGLTTQEKLFLHELYLLLNHFNYDTVKIIGVFFTDLRMKNKISFNLRDFLYPDNSVKYIEKSKNSEVNPFKSTIQNSTTLTRLFFE